MNPVIKFTTLFGLLAVELAVTLTAEGGAVMSRTLAGAFFAVSVVFVWRSFYGMRIGQVPRRDQPELSSAGHAR
jgi:K(+)-stimulated pyrophosphate-energized sodium pump